MIENLKNKVVIAPMAGISDRAFREIAEQFGAGLVFTEMISSKGLYYQDKKTEQLLDIGSQNTPVCAQIFGHEPSVIASVANMAAKHGASCLDINAGCPTPKIVKNLDGAALLRNSGLLEAVLESAVSNAEIPVSVKIRAGWDSTSINAVQLAKIAEKCGVCMITVHGRTAADFYSGNADWDIIKEVVRCVSIPVIGNGDVFSAQDAKQMLDYTGCAAVMLGRATLGNPWVIRDTVLFLENKAAPPPPDIKQKIEMALRHVRLLVKYKGEYSGIRQARKHVLWYIKGISRSAGIKNLISSAQSYDEMKGFLAELL